MMNKLRLLGLLLAVCYLAGCAATPSVFTDFDQSQPFENYQTFTWMSDKPMIVSGDRGPNPIVAKRLQDDIKTTLEEKGFKFVAEKKDANFVVAFTVGARDKLEIRERETVSYYGSHWRWGQDYFGVVYPRDIYPRGVRRTEVTTRKYAEGSLSIDIFDVERKSPVWHGSASKRLSRDELQGRSVESTRMAVQTILSGFPPQ